MAASTIEKTQLRLQFDNGKIDDRQRYKSKTISNITENATDDNLLAVSNAINSVTEKEVLITQKVVVSTLS